MEKILVYEGGSTYGEVAFTIVGNKIYRGKRSSGAQDYTIYNNRIYEGKSAIGTPLFTIDNYRIYPGKSKWGKPLYTIDNNKIYNGNSKWGKPAYTLDISGIFRPTSFWEELSLFVDDGSRQKRNKARKRKAKPLVKRNSKTEFAMFILLMIISVVIAVSYKVKEIKNQPAKQQTVQQESQSTADVSTSDDEAAKEASNINEYVFPDSDSRLLTEDEVSGLSKETIRFAINEIYARRGRIFEDEVLKEYFEAKSWYEPRYKKDEFPEDVFNEFEKANIDLLVKYR